MKNILLAIAQDRKKGFAAFILKPFLYFLSLLYGSAVCLVSFCYLRRIFPRYRPSAKVISVGNITLGGTGKTPFIEYLLEYLKTKGRSCAVLSRGYSADEPLMLQKKFPAVKMLSGKDRIDNAKKAQAEVLILDDGFQHWKLARDLDIVTVNCCDPFGNKNLIPCGILRERVSSLRRADAIILTKSDLCGNVVSLKEYLKKVAPKALIAEAEHRPCCFLDTSDGEKELDCIRGKNLCLLSSIADPASFKETLARLGARVALEIVYPDHYQYSRNDILDVVRKSYAECVDVIVTTEKDLMRLPVDIICGKIQLLVLQIKLAITQNEEELLQRISDILKR